MWSNWWPLVYEKNQECQEWQQWHVHPFYPIWFAQWDLWEKISWVYRWIHVARLKIKHMCIFHHKNWNHCTYRLCGTPYFTDIWHDEWLVNLLVELKQGHFTTSVTQGVFSALALGVYRGNTNATEQKHRGRITYWYLEPNKLTYHAHLMWLNSYSIFLLQNIIQKSWEQWFPSLSDQT